MLKGFREFALRGNFIDLAVAVVVGAAVAALIGAISAGLILPLVGIFLGGGVDAGQIEINGQVIDISLIINAFIVFVITMAVIYFAFVLPMNKIRERMGQEDIAATPADVALLTEIRDLLQAQQGQHAAAVLAAQPPWCGGTSASSRSSRLPKPPASSDVTSGSSRLPADGDAARVEPAAVSASSIAAAIMPQLVARDDEGRRDLHGAVGQAAREHAALAHAAEHARHERRVGGEQRRVERDGAEQPDPGADVDHVLVAAQRHEGGRERELEAGDPLARAARPR